MSHFDSPEIPFPGIWSHWSKMLTNFRERVETSVNVHLWPQACSLIVKCCMLAYIEFDCAALLVIVKRISC